MYITFYHVCLKNIFYSPYPVKPTAYPFFGSFGKDEYPKPSIGKALIIPS